MKRILDGNVRFRRFLVALLSVSAVAHAQSANRSAAILYDTGWISGPNFRLIAFDQTHQQIFTGWTMLDRVDVLSAADYHLIQSIRVPSPSTLDISPDGTTLAVGTSSSHILFFDTGTFAQTNDLIFPDSALGVTAFVYTANGNAIIQAGGTVYWDHSANAFLNGSSALGVVGPYQTGGPVARSGDATRIMVGDPTTGGVVQFIDGNTGQIVQTLSYFSNYIVALAANKDASRYALCVQPPAFTPTLLILDSSFDEIYQDENGCIGMTFSADGNTLYRDTNAATATQAIDMNTFSIRTSMNLFNQSAFATHWQAADSTGIVYGVNPGFPAPLMFEAIDTTAASTPPVPALNDPVQIVRVIDNIGSPQGGDLIRLLCAGVDTVTAGSVSVTIGGAAATNLTIAGTGAPAAPIFATLPNLRIVEVKTPPGSPGLSDVTLSVNGISYTAVKAFQFVQTSKLFPFPTSPNFLLYDSFRKKLYAAHKDQVEVIDPIAQQVLTPLVPASGKLPNSQFAGLSLSPDGNRLYIADAGTNLIHVLDLGTPGSGTDINPGTAMGSPAPISPARVFETASGRVLGSDANGSLFVIDPRSGIGTQVKDEFGNLVVGVAWSSSNNGRYILITSAVDNLVSGNVGIWDDITSEYTASRGITQSFVEASSNEDGTIILVGGSTPGLLGYFPEAVDFKLNSIGFIENHFDVAMPQGTPSFFLHPSGSLLYKAGDVSVSGGEMPFGGLVEIDDLHQSEPAATIAFPEMFITSYSPFTDHMLATDETGRYFFGVTQSGITMMTLTTIPLSIGNIEPAFGQPAGGETVTIRGSGFQAGAAASFGSTAAATTFVDESTVTVLVPALPSGWQDVTVTNPTGTSYKAHGMFQVVGAFPTPVITGFSPATLTTPGFQQPITITIVGSGFAPEDVVQINGQPTDSIFANASHIQAAVPGGFTGQTGSIPFTVVSPYTGASNTLSVQVVNPVPVIHYSFPESLVVGSSSANLNVYGVGFVTGSEVQWNGQNLSTTFVGGQTSAGDQLVIASIPGSLLASSGTATITIFDPAPGGGTSNAFTEGISTAQPVVSFPASVSFGQVLINTTATQTLQVPNLGSANYTISSVLPSSTLFSAQTSFCAELPPFNLCDVQVQFSPTAVGTAQATLTIMDNAPGSPRTISLNGIGTQTLVPLVTLTSIDAFDQTVSAIVNGTVNVGGTGVPGTAWIEYGTDPSLASYTRSSPWSFTGDSSFSVSFNGLSPTTLYAGRVAVQTSGGLGRSGIRLFATLAAWPEIILGVATGSSNIATISAGQIATYNLLVSDGGNGYTGMATFSCSGVPSGASCSATPSALNIGLNATPFTITITTTAPSTASLRPSSTGSIWAMGFLLAAGMLAFGTKRHHPGFVICVFLLAMFAYACGSSSSSTSTSNGGGTPGTPPGMYFVIVNASTAGAQTSQLLTLTVR